MFESTGWNLVEPSNDDTSKYDNICPTVVCWKPDKEQDSATVEVLVNLPLISNSIVFRWV